MSRTLLRVVVCVAQLQFAHVLRADSTQLTHHTHIGVACCIGTMHIYVDASFVVTRVGSLNARALTLSQRSVARHVCLCAVNPYLTIVARTCSFTITSFYIGAHIVCLCDCIYIPVSHSVSSQCLHVMLIGRVRIFDMRALRNHIVCRPCV